MVYRIDEDWRILSADPAEGGYLSVYYLTVATPDGPRYCVLKAPPDDDHGIDAAAAEARRRTDRLIGS